MLNAATRLMYKDLEGTNSIVGKKVSNKPAATRHLSALGASYQLRDNEILSSNGSELFAKSKQAKRLSLDSFCSSWAT